MKVLYCCPVKKDKIIYSLQIMSKFYRTAIKVLLDNGHGDPPITGDKHSPDNRLKEYVYCREIAQRVSRELTLRGIDTILLVPEKTDTPLKERVRKANGWAQNSAPRT
ncbi:hypothetical protein [Bacteroides acidifaciens]|uniref:hypothetical protein n=1 Tax=Bacteroides acidifaciens TaxID=85831 RepID=UPI00301484BD